MEIKPPTVQPPAAQTLASVAKRVAAFQVGQVVHATAIGTPERGTVLLRIGHETVRAQTAAPLQTGQRLTLEVVSSGPRPMLRPLDASSMQDVVANAMRSALPRQTSLPKLLANLLAMTAATQTSTSSKRAQPGGTVPAEVMNLIKATVKGIATTEQVSTPRGLKLALRDSGPYLEQRLAQQPTTATKGDEPKHDLKANLLRLSRALQSSHGKAAEGSTRGMHASARSNSGGTFTSAALASRLPPIALPPVRNTALPPQKSPPAVLGPQSSTVPQLGELLQQTQGALARIELTQLAGLPSEDTPDPGWVVELPMRNKQEVDVLQARIEHRRPSGEEDQDVWSVTLTLNLKGLGPVYATLSLAGQNLSTVFWAEHSASAMRIRDHLDLLQAKLRGAGLTVDKIECRHGRVPSPEPPAIIPGILDERA